MKIYAIRDRMIDYFQQPFAGPDDKAVMQAVARSVNNGETTSDIAQAPHHFELWKLGEVTEDGHLVPERQIVCDLSSLVRGGVRENGDQEQRGHTPRDPTGRPPGAPEGA